MGGDGKLASSTTLGVIGFGFDVSHAQGLGGIGDEDGRVGFWR